jgi:hypothetical protein
MVPVIDSRAAARYDAQIKILKFSSVVFRLCLRV